MYLERLWVGQKTRDIENIVNDLCVLKYRDHTWLEVTKNIMPIRSYCKCGKFTSC